MAGFRVKRCLIPQHAIQLGLELREVAERAEITPSQLSDYISLRRKPGIENAKSIAAVLKVTIDDLYEWDVRRLKR